VVAYLGGWAAQRHGICIRLAHRCFSEWKFGFAIQRSSVSRYTLRESLLACKNRSQYPLYFKAGLLPSLGLVSRRQDANTPPVCKQNITVNVAASSTSKKEYRPRHILDVTSSLIGYEVSRPRLLVEHARGHLTGVYYHRLGIRTDM
jgi:hypothetical protein